MPDKIVNHFVLADGSTAKYSAEHLVGDVPEVVDIRTGYDGVVYPNAGDAVRGQVGGLKNDLSYIQDEIGLSFIPMSGSATIPATAYQSTTLINGIMLEHGKTYNITMSVSASLAATLYGYLSDKDGNTLKILNVTTGNTTASYTYMPGADYPDAYIYFKVNNYTGNDVSATIEEANATNRLDDIEERLDGVEETQESFTALPKWLYKEYNGYFNTNGTIHVPTVEDNLAEKYTSKMELSGFDRVEFTQDVGDNQKFNAYVLYDENGDVVGSRVVWYTNDTKVILPSDTTGAKYIAFSYRTYGQYHPTIRVYKPVWIDTETTDETKTMLDNSFRFKSCYDHLFVGRGGNNVTIPHESLYHVRLSRLFGFNTIEANVAKTSDGVFFVNHLSGGKFGNYFHHVDGTTDISNTAANTVTWAWIEENVRYNSTIPKYRTRPCTLEEFLSECRQQNIIPFVTSSDPDAVEIAKSIMGENNYIAYGGNRTTNPDAIIYHWITRTTKQDIVDYCESVGKPFIYGMANPSAFTDSELQDIVDTLHEMGYWIGTSYADSLWSKYAYMGFDVNGTQKQVNRIDNGNVCNYNTVLGFNDFNFTNATEADGVLTYSGDGTLSPKSLPNTNGIYMFDLEIEFIGDIAIPSIGEWNETAYYNSDGSEPVFVCVPIVNGSPALSLNVYNGTIVKDVKYKLSKI